MAAIFGESKIFWKLPKVYCLDTLWIENFDEIALSRMIKEINLNKIGKSRSLRYPVGQKFWQNRSISHS